MYDFFDNSFNLEWVIPWDFSYVRSICCESRDIFGQSSDEGDVLVFHEGVVITARDEGNGSLAVLHTPVTCNTHILIVKISIIKPSLFVLKDFASLPYPQRTRVMRYYYILDTTVLRPHKPAIVWSLTNVNRSQIKLIYHVSYVLCSFFIIVYITFCPVKWNATGFISYWIFLTLVKTNQWYFSPTSSVLLAWNRLNICCLPQKFICE